MVLVNVLVSESIWTQSSFRVFRVFRGEKTPGWRPISPEASAYGSWSLLVLAQPQEYIPAISGAPGGLRGVTLSGVSGRKKYTGEVDVLVMVEQEA